MVEPTIPEPQSADELLELLVAAELDAAPTRIRFASYGAMGTGLMIQVDDTVIAEAADQDVDDLSDDGYVRIRGDYIDLTDSGRERARLLLAAARAAEETSGRDVPSARSANETWSWRELPLLREALPLVDAGEQPGLTALAKAVGITQEEARAAAAALEPEFISMRWMPGSGSPPLHGMVTAVHGPARRALGTWPSPEGIADQLVAALRDAADRTDDPEEEGRLRDAAEELSVGVVKSVLVSYITRLLTGFWPT